MFEDIILDMIGYDRWKDYVGKGTNRRRLEELVDEILIIPYFCIVVKN
jgi:hypothetical protein